MLSKRLFLCSSVAILCSGVSAYALTAEQAWADLQAMAAKNGSEVKAATEVKNDGTMTLNGVTAGPAGQPARVTIAEVVIEEQADGSVVFLPDDIKIEKSDTTTASIAEDALAVRVFKDAGGLGYGVTADRLSISFDDNQGTAETAVRNAGTFNFEGLVANYGRAVDAITFGIDASRVVYDLANASPAAGMDSVSTSDTANLSMTGKISVPEGIDISALDDDATFADAVNRGLALTATMTNGPSNGTMTDKGTAAPFSATFAGEGGATNIVADKSRLLFDASVPGMKLEITPPGMPMPLPVSMDSMSMTYEMPISAPEGGAYQLKLGLSNLVVSEAIWGMFDPGAALPRDAATLDIDISGQAKLDLLGMAAAEKAGTPPPMPEPISLDVKALGLKLAGAALSGNGAFTFDNSMLAMGGPPMPIGTANLRLEGGNKLIDGLIATGLLKEEDAMGARMMMAMFGKSEGDDILTSQIEAKEGGAIFVNGQQVQ